jgi:hypothetical protein
MIRVDFHLKERQVVALKELSKKTEVKVAELIRRAIDAFLEAQPKG